MERKKESKIVEFCNSPLGALVIVGGLMTLGAFTNHYLVKNNNYHGLNSYFIEEREEIVNKY